VGGNAKSRGVEESCRIIEHGKPPGFHGGFFFLF
jgi:hypothetical protein